MVVLKMAKQSDSTRGKDRKAGPVTTRKRGEMHEQILMETPEETREAIARIKGHFVEVERAISEEKKNPNAVALGRLGGLKSGKIRKALSVSRKKSRSTRKAA